MEQNPDVICRRLGERAVLVDLGTNEIFELNHTGYRVWELIGEGLDLTQVVDRLNGEFEVGGAQLQQDVEELVNRFRTEKLILEKT